MRRFALAVATLLIATPVFADDAPNADVMAPIQAFSEGMSTGDIAKAMAAHVANPTIIDEFPPYSWSGANSFQSWGGDFQKDATAKGITGSKLAIGKIHRTLVEGDHAYVVADANYSFKQGGMGMSENAVMTFVLDKTDAGWKIASWTFAY